jgi:glycosyltransferase involved in cell wall biosynthesis
VTHPRPVVFDLQATQSVDQRHRGIPRYVADLAYAIEDVSPGSVGAYVVNPDLALPEPGVTDGLVGAGKLRRVDDIDWSGVGALHIASPLEMTRPGHRLLPPAAQAAGVPLIVTFYDLIPQLMPQYYLEDPGLRRRYRARLQLVRLATAVLTLSESTRADVIEHLGLDPRRVFVVGAGTSDRFRPPESRQAAAAEAVAAVPGLRAPYVFYIGSYERRKNLEPLLEAWALLPPEIRARWQLAMCCPLKWSERHHLLWRAAGLRIVDSLCLTGFVTDEVLLRLHQGSDLFVFPSLYEGYGLPVAEALACGAPVLAADASSLPEILAPEFLFDATSPPPIAAAIERGLTDESFRAELLAASGRPPTTWTEVASATVAVYDRVLAGELLPPESTSPRGRAAIGRLNSCRVAVVAPLPPAGPTATWNAALITELANDPDLDVSAFVERPDGTVERPLSPVAPAGVNAAPLAGLEPAEGLRGPFDAVVYCLADDEHHTGSLALLRRRRDGIVVTRSAHLATLYSAAARAGALPEGLQETIAGAYGDAVVPGTGAHGTIDAAEARRLGVLLIRDVVAHARRVLVTDPSETALARLDAGRRGRDRIDGVDDDPAAVARALKPLLAAPAAAR